ncbi:beta-galactosidase [Cellulosilyticum sp. I15G10I2]|uniref:beta-galactosidase n=1 Tax=Cellulosilyticum sp. I15G10I2 TaxID=1892843 RepID=UPI00085CD5ED|nr:beta-galactosidase [Cellulosilyticum sp. I15G10I2]
MDYSQILYGGDYNPEQWLKYPDILEKDVLYMKKAHINTVTLGVFSWAILEPEEGNFCFSWLEDIMDNLYAHGIAVILATPSGARPKWLAELYPEVLRVDESRNRNLFGGRHNHCYTSPVYREKVRRINKELALRLGKHPAVILWHISNEYGGECHCPLCQQAFRVWLQKKYASIEVLNESWCTTFWSHIYQSFAQIESPSSRGESMIHGLNLDWKRFVTDQTVDFVRREIKAIKSEEPNKPITINMMYDYEGLNYHKFADIIDIVSWDSYPTWHKDNDYETAMQTGMQHDIMRCIKHKPFLLMESCPSATNWQGVSKLKKPNMLAAASFQALAHGSNSVLYFQIRQSRGSCEKFHGAVIDHYGGEDTRVFREVSDLGKQLGNIKELLGTVVHADVAVVYDWENRWAMKDAMGPRNKGLFYKEVVEKSYSAFRKQGLNVDVIDMEQDISAYKIVAAPMVYLFRCGFEERVRKFVEQGGIFVLTYWSGIVDENDRCFLGGTPHGLLDVMGMRSMEIDALYDGESNFLVPAENTIYEIASKYRCQHLCDLIEVTTARALMIYQDDFYHGYPAVTVNRFGGGQAYYIGADVEQKCYDDLYRHLLKEADLEPLIEGTISEGIEITSRKSQNAEYIIIQNYNDTAVQMNLSENRYHVLRGASIHNIPSLETLILKRKQ